MDVHVSRESELKVGLKRRIGSLECKREIRNKQSDVGELTIRVKKRF